MLGNHRKCFLAATAVISLAVSTPAVAQTKSYNIPAQPVSSSINALAKQGDIQVIAPQRITRGVRGNAVQGNMVAEDALRLLLAGTGLTFRKSDSRTFVIEPSRRGNALAGAPNAGTEVASSSGEENNQPSAVEESSSLGGGHTSTNEATPEILVVGRRTLNLDIRRTEDDAQPYVVFESDEIRQSPSRTIDEFFKTRLPMNTIQFSPVQINNSPSGNQNRINLRGLGVNQTLILVDGRRMPNISQGSGTTQPDINGIPLAAIERIEILPATASGIYGGGATGGVINIITRKDYRGIVLGLTYGNTFRGDMANYRADLTAGASLEGGRTRAMLTASYALSDPLYIGDREFNRAGRALLFANNPGAFLNAPTPPLGFTTNIRSVDNSNLVLDDGTPLNSPRTFVPVGYSGISSDGGRALISNAGQYNLEPANDINSRKLSLLNNPSIVSITGNLRRKFDDRVDAFVDLAWLENEGRERAARPPSPSFTLAADAPNNPFTTPILVTFPIPNLSDYERISRSTTVRATAGLVLRLPRSWAGSFDYTWSRSKSFITNTDPIIGDPDGSGPGQPVSAALSSGTLDVVRDVNAFPLDYSQYLFPSPNFRSKNVLDLNDVNARLSGPLFRLWGNPISLSLAAEYLHEDKKEAFEEGVNTNAVPEVFFSARATRAIRSLFGEVKIPIVSESNARPFARLLEITGALRHDAYDTKVPVPPTASLPSRDTPVTLDYGHRKLSATEATLSVRYSPIRDLMVRASYGTGFLPPAINQTTPGRPITFPAFPLTDPKRGGVAGLVGPVTFQLGGSPDLRPESSKSLSIGALITPSFLTGLRASIDYTIINKKDELTSLPIQTIIDLEDTLPGRITRGPLTNADQALGYSAGPITGINASTLNLATTRIRAIDIQIDYEAKTRFGNFQVNTIATWQPKFGRRTIPGTNIVESAGYNAGPLKWKGNAGIHWDNGPWSAGINAQYYDSYFVYPAGSSAASISLAELNQGSSKIPSQVYVDANIGWRFNNRQAASAGLLSNLEVSLSIQNLLDKRPPIEATALPNGFGYSTYGDPRLRNFRLTIRRSF